MGNKRNRSILLLVNHEVVIYNFRLELVERLLAEGYEVHISCPWGEKLKELEKLGAVCHDIVIDRHGMNPFYDLRVILTYIKLIRAYRPMMVFTYTVKPNVYGGIAAKLTGTPFVANVTGLGITINNGGVKRALVLFLYRLGLWKARKVFFQNEENREYMLERHIISSPWDMLPGSGVNLKRHSYEPYPGDGDGIVFSTIGRIMRDKGINELIEAARIIRGRHPETSFRLMGYYDGGYEAVIRAAEEEGILTYLGEQRDIHPRITESHAIIHPSYHEGMSNVLLEAAATGRPVLASNVTGCRETFEEGVTGIGFRPKDVSDLVRAIEDFLALSYEQKAMMGIQGRKKMEREFDREIVVEAYMEELG